MDEFEAAEILRSGWSENTDLVHFSRIVLAICPFCGKGDRIRLLASPQEIGGLSDENYLAAWKILAGIDQSPGICGFCFNVVLVSDGGILIPGME